MAGPSLRQAQPLGCAPTISVNKSSNKPPLRTYSKHALQGTIEPPNKRQRIELPEISKQNTAQSVIQPSTPTLPKKRSISEYFRPVSHTRTPQSSCSSIFSSDPVHQSTESPPSSPLSPYISFSAELPKKRPRRRLTARPPLAIIKMSDINAGRSMNTEKTSTSPNIQDETPSPRKGVQSDTDTDVRQTGNHMPPSEPIGIPRVRNVTEQEDLYTPFLPHHPDPSNGPVFRPLIGVAAARNLSFESMVTLIEGSVTGSPLVANSGFLHAGVPARSAMREDIQANEYIRQREMLLRSQPDDPGMMFAMSEDGGTGHSIMENNDNFQSSGNQSQAPETSTNSVPSMQSQIAATPASQMPVITASTDLVQSNIPAANNLPQGSANLVQTQISLGPPALTTCELCRVTYNTTLPADIRMHDDFHSIITMGEPVNNLVTTVQNLVKSIDTGIGEGDYIVRIDSSSTGGWKALAVAVLGHVDKEIGSVSIIPDVLWSKITDPIATGAAGEASKVDRFKVFLYIHRWLPRQARVVSLLLAERIKIGFETKSIRIEDNESTSWPSIVPLYRRVVSSVSHEAVLGVNKFWTISRSRHRGMGKALLDGARKNFIPSYVVPRVHVAWTSPTSDGAVFAKRYLRLQADYDFLTYDDQM